MLRRVHSSGDNHFAEAPGSHEEAGGAGLDDRTRAGARYRPVGAWRWLGHQRQVAGTLTRVHASWAVDFPEAARSRAEARAAAG